MEANNFREWQVDYAAHNIPTFPVEFIRVGDQVRKKPLVRSYGRFGLASSTNIAGRFADASGIGFVCGRRSGVTVLDVDTRDERILADAVMRAVRAVAVIRHLAAADGAAPGGA